MSEMASELKQIRGKDYRTNRPVVLTVKDGYIVRIESDAPDANTDDLPIVGPGLVDLQINGYMGHDFNTFPLSVDTVIAGTRALGKEGITAYFPTVTTNSDDRIEEALRTIATACVEDELCARMIAGIHLEGPFISPEDGPRGAHLAVHVKPPDSTRIRRWQVVSGGRIRIVTCSPEWPESAAFIKFCTDSGITVAIGHTAATSDQIREAVDAGARLSTHLGNGCHLRLPRHPNYLWEQIAQESLAACMIADGFHLPESFIKVVLKTKGRQAVLVSDCVDLGGMPPGTYYSHGRVHVVKTAEGKLHLRDNEKLLAGSVQTLSWGIANMVRWNLCSLPEAWDMASIGPSIMMSLNTAHGMTEGAPADLVLFRWEGSRIRIVQTYKHGKELLL